jgi:hypothetical protein
MQWSARCDKFVNGVNKHLANALDALTVAESQSMVMQVSTTQLMTNIGSLYLIAAQHFNMLLSRDLTSTSRGYYLKVGEHCSEGSLDDAIYQYLKYGEFAKDTDRQLMDDGLVDEAFVLEEYFGSSVYSMFDGVVHTSLNQDFGHETQRH